MFELDPLVALCIVIVLKIVTWLVDEFVTWKNHLWLAAVISDWHRDELKKKMKAQGIKHRPVPLPVPLLALPHRWMVLSCVMMSMWSVAMAGHVVKPPPVTWVAALGNVRDLHHSFPPPPPPEPPPSLPQPLAPPSNASNKSFTDGEGEEDGTPAAVNQWQISDALDWQDLLDLTICRPCSDDDVTACTDTTTSPSGDATTCPDWSCLDSVLMCLKSKMIPSFGPLGLLSGIPEPTVPSIDMKEAFVDTAASLTVTPFRDDFIDYIPMEGTVMQGLSAGANIAGRGTIHWRLDVGNKIVDLKLRALHVPSTEHRLLCPQQLKKEHEPTPKAFTIEDDGVSLEFAEGTVFCPCNDSNIPVLSLSGVKESEEELKALNACVTLENNQNLSTAQKELLKWHCRLGHVALPRIQKLMKAGALGNHPKIKAAAHLDLDKHPFKCGSCEYGKARRRASRKGKHARANPEPMKQLSKEVLIPGQKVSMDHFIVSTPGRLFSSRGSEPPDKMYKGGVIFVDHATGFVFIVPVVNFTAGEALRAKREFELELASMGVTVLSYHTDNGVFTAAAFQDELANKEQGMTLSGVGAHHQNAVAERAIGTASAMTRTIMLHAKMRWPKAVTTKLWPMAMKQAQFLINHVPLMNNVCPMDLMLRTVVPRDNLRHVHVWGAPCFVLDPKLQDGHKIPKFDPRSRQGLNLGWSPKHAATVPLVLNLTTGNISPQFHVVIDDWFTTVSSIADRDEAEPIDGDTWTNLLLNERIQVAFDEDDPVEVDEEWLSEMERLEKHQKAVTRVQGRLHPTAPLAAMEPPAFEEPTRNDESVPPASPLPPPVPPAVPDQREQSDESKSKPPALPQQREQSPTKPIHKQWGEIDKSNILPSGTTRTRRSTFRGLCCTALMAISNTPIMAMAKACVGSPAAHLAMAGFDAVTETFDCVDFHSYRAMTTPVSRPKKGQDPDYPTYEQVMRSPDVEEWKESMDKEVNTLIGMDTWTVVPRAEAIAKGKKVIKVTWAFRQKRDPMGNPTKKKSRLCVRGDTMVAGIDYGESFSPVVQWSSVRLMLILSIVHGLETRQVDYVNAFAQADLDRDVYVEIPKGYGHLNEGMDCVLKLNKSLYGMSDAPLMFFELLKKNLLEVGFQQFTHIDPCLFVHKNAICLTNVDDCPWFGKGSAALDWLISEMKKRLDLTVESNNVSNFLGIKFTRQGDTIELKQTGLINKIIEATDMQDANGKPTPADPKTLGKDVNGKPFKELWAYASVVGMLLYLSGNSRPGIAFAVNQAA